MLNFLMSSRIFILCILPILFIVPGCGGGGSDGDGGGGGTPPPTPTSPIINYSVAQSSMTPLLTGTTSGLTFTVTVIDLAGTYNTDTTVTTLAENKKMNFTVSGGPLGATAIQISTPAGSLAQWNSGDNPTSGMFDVSSTYVDPVRVKVISGGVEIWYNGSMVSSMSWSNFKSAVETSSNDYEILASLAYNGLQTVYRCLSVTYTMLELVMENQDTLAQSGMDFHLVTDLPGYPSGLHIQLEDKDSNHDVNPGDGFLSRFSNWWANNPGSNQDYIYSGRLLWLNYWEGSNYVGGDFKIGVSGDAFHEDEVNGGVPDLGTRMTFQESGFQLILSW